MHVTDYAAEVKEMFEAKGISVDDEVFFLKVLELVKDRCTLLTDFYDQAHYFYTPPAAYDEASVKPKWDEGKAGFFREYCQRLLETAQLEHLPMTAFETMFKEIATEKNIKVGELQMIFRVMLVGSKTGPGVFVIAETIGRDATVERIENAVKSFS